jgi:DNA (cytosine-5)-methyltransferase 1
LSLAIILSIIIFELNAAHFGVPQIRRRLFFVCFHTLADLKNFKMPQPTHISSELERTRFDNVCRTNDLFENSIPKTMGVRKALGLSDIGYDSLAPTLRSAFTGKRNTTSVLNIDFQKKESKLEFGRTKLRSPNLSLAEPS